jgi:hypothetical protein
LDIDTRVDDPLNFGFCRTTIAHDVD